MIITKNWLNEWVDLGSISTEEIAWTLNSIGLEVAAVTHISLPQNIVVAKVLECNAHENSDHLHVCLVDIGSAEKLQIVCGAPNVAAGQFVACALTGAIMPNGLEIKAAKLRGVESFGMLCSASELGLGKLNDGIMLLDESIGELVLGKELREYAAFSDDIIEVELTPNRGDCMSAAGIARDIAAALELPLKERVKIISQEAQLGIGRVLGLHAEGVSDIALLYRVAQIKQRAKLGLLRHLRLVWAGYESGDGLGGILQYATNSSGVILRAYDLDRLSDEKAELNIKKLDNGGYGVFYGDKLLSVAGIWQNGDFAADDSSANIIFEASFVPPELVSMVVGEDKNQPKDIIVFRTSRGSEPSLNSGMDGVLSLFGDSISVCGGTQQIALNEGYKKQIGLQSSEIAAMIGADISKNEIVRILKNLGFELNVGEQEQIYALIPQWRSDIKNVSDICEEIVRITGIDKIEAAPMSFSEADRTGGALPRYKMTRKIRTNAANAGYFECVSYLFDNPARLNELGFNYSGDADELLNPISAELSVLRPTLINSLLAAAELNAKNAKKSIKLFECGSVIDENKNQGERLAVIASGLKSEPSITAGAKPAEMTLLDFASDIQKIIGQIELKKSENILWASPFEQAQIWQNSRKIGVLARLHLKIQEARDLFKTYICEIDLNEVATEIKRAKAYSKFPSISRELSLLIDENSSFNALKECINALKIDDLKEFYPIDLYKGSELKDKQSLSVKFIFQNMDRSLTDDEVATEMQKILNALKSSLGVDLR